MAGRAQTCRDRPRPGLLQRRHVPDPHRTAGGPAPQTGTEIHARLAAASLALDKLLDLDLAIIEDAYQAERLARQPGGRTPGDARPDRRGGGPRAPQPPERRQDLGLLPAPRTAPTPEKTAEHFNRIERHVELADGVITALSNFARMPVPEARPFDVGDCIREALDLADLPATIEVSLRRAGAAAQGRAPTPARSRSSSAI